ncbi:YtxH domain-containing protein [Streptomyces sp. DSM 44915]|uniref:YtxH domain-containing protein n=1 Tax=Streptomyces chisholmiae TaxID=3075540 RepID=A0ABU2JQ09_9ACTN|nr:YtxH domain-containing protein [Streptomyces sp. DSM 44915]MDT0266818.1 YtxH domain-containing protein [Streptomyces sp. DSM 44915]
MRKLVFVAGLAVGYVLGAKAGRERYEQLRASAERVRSNPAVRNGVDSAALAGRQAAARAAGAVVDRAGDRLPEGVAGKLRAVGGRESASDETFADDWGTTR